MGMYISIGEDTGWGLSTGIFDLIVESTRELFSDDEQKCLKAIYRSYDDEGQSFIVLRNVDANCFNLFYKHCNSALENFIENGHENIEPKYVPFIVGQWSQVLKLIREDERFVDPEER